MIWSFNNGRLPNNAHHEDNSNFLFLSNVEAANEGYYECHCPTCGNLKSRAHVAVNGNVH